MKDIELQASDECVVGIGKTMAGGKPDFTVTAVQGDIVNGHLVVQWETVSAGFGELTFVFDGGKLICVDNEAMSERFIAEVIKKLAESVEIRR